MPRGLIGTLVLGTSFFIVVSLVLVGMFKYSLRAINNAEPGCLGFARVWPLPDRQPLIRCRLDRDLLGLDCHLLASSRLIYAFGRDGLLPSFLGSRRRQAVPNRALWTINRVGDDFWGRFSLHLLSNLVSAGTLVAFIFVSLGIYALRRREGRTTRSPVQDAGLPDLAGGISISAVIFGT